MTRKQKIWFIIGVIIAVSLIIYGLMGCSLNQNLTPTAQYYSALKIWNDNVDTYLEAYNAAPPATQAKWKAKIDPLLLAASEALDRWHLSIGSPDQATKEAVWQDARKKAMSMLTQFGILKVEGK